MTIQDIRYQKLIDAQFLKDETYKQRLEKDEAKILKIFQARAEAEAMAAEAEQRREIKVRQILNLDELEPSTEPTPSIDMAEHEDITPMEQLAISLNTELRGADQVYSMKSGMMVSAQREDGEYRKVAVAPADQFLFEEAYIGGRGSLIFKFLPVGVIVPKRRDDPPFVRIEIPCDRAIEQMHRLEEEIIEHFGADMAYMINQAKTVGKTKAGRKKLKEVAEQKAVETQNIHNPDWGQF